MKSFDIIVVGSGSGLEVSAEAAWRGLSVAVVDYHAMPHAIFASPQVASVGTTEETLKEN